MANVPIEIDAGTLDKLLHHDLPVLKVKEGIKYLSKGSVKLLIESADVSSSTGGEEASADTKTSADRSSGKVSSIESIPGLSSVSDLEPSKYEGGFKVWESTKDLLELLYEDPSLVRGKTVLDVGCGAGLLGIGCLLLGSNHVAFQDFNLEVLKWFTLPNIVINLRPSTTGTLRPSTTSTLRPSTTGTLRPSTTGTLRSSAINASVISTPGTSAAKYEVLITNASDNKLESERSEVEKKDDARNDKKVDKKDDSPADESSATSSSTDIETSKVSKRPRVESDELRGAAMATSAKDTKPATGIDTIPATAKDTKPATGIDTVDTLRSKVSLYSGDWSETPLPSNHFDVILTSETIYNQDNYPKLGTLFEKCIKPKGQIIVGAKTHYFGVGGGTRSFEQFLSSRTSLEESKILKVINSPVQREIIMFTN